MSAGRDVVVIGGGAAGASTAYALAAQGASVTLLDAARPGRATSASAGGLWPLGESLGLGCGVIFHAAQGGSADAAGGPDPLPRRFMEFLCASNERFPALAPELEDLTGMDIEVESGTGLLYLLYDAGQQQHAARILDWLGEGGRAAMWTPHQVREREPLLTTELVGAVHFPGDNQVNPMLLAEALKRGAAARGARFLAETSARGFVIEHGRVIAVETSRGRIPCGAVVNAAGAWAGEIAALAGLELPVTPVRGQIVCTETLAAGTLRSNLSTRDCYILQKSHGEVIVGSTTEHCGFDVAVRHDKLAALARGGVRAVPALARAQVKRTWAGLRPGTPDELPILGPGEELDNFHHAAGGFRTGIVAAPLTGEVVAAVLLGNEPPFPIEPFLPRRFNRIGAAS